MRAVALALALGLLLVPSATATTAGPTLLVRDPAGISILYLDRPTPFRQPLARTWPYRPLAFSGDGRLISIGGTIVGRAKLPTRTLAWAPTGERAAYVTTEGGVMEWTPAGLRRLEPKGWGAQWPNLAWSADDALAVARGSSLWVIRGRSARQVVRPIPADCCTGGPSTPVPVAWSGDRVLWWRWPGSGSVAADGVSLYAGTQRLGTTLMYPDYVAVCGTHVAFVEGTDRDSTDNKTIVFDGRDVSQDPHHSWASPSCTPGGRLVATASRNDPNAFREPHRSIWQLLPTRRQLTHAPWGWSDEDPRLRPDGSLLFVRSRFHSVQRSGAWYDTQTGRVMLLSRGRLTQVAQIGYANLDELQEELYLGPYFGHYDWSQLLAVGP